MTLKVSFTFQLAKYFCYIHSKFGVDIIIISTSSGVCNVAETD